MADVKVAGSWLHERGHVSGVSWSSRWGSGPCGDDIAACSFAVDAANDTSELVVDASFEVWDEGVLVFGGTIDGISRDYPRQVTAKGLPRRAEDFEALTGLGAPSSDILEAVSEAIGRGLEWTNAAAFPATDIGGDPSNARRLNALLSEWGDSTGNRWGADSYGRAFAVPEPTTPTYLLDAAGLDIGVDAEGMYTRVNARYVATVDGAGNPATWDTESAEVPSSRPREYTLNLTQLGLMDPATALGYASAQLALRTAPRWLSRATVAAGSLLSPGGLPARLSAVRAGQVVRLSNVPANIGGNRAVAALDVVLGEVSYDTGQPTQVTLAPVNLAVRTVADAFAAARAS